MKIETEITTMKTSYDDLVVQIYVDLPSGSRLYFSDVWLDPNSSKTDEEQAEYAKDRLSKQLKEFIRFHGLQAEGIELEQRIDILEAALRLAQRRFELLACANDESVNGVRPSVGAAECRDALDK